MKRVKLIFIFSLLFVITACNKKIQSTWLENDIIIDGSSYDWKNMPLQLNEELKIMYGMANNDSILKIMFRFKDHRLARQFENRGIRLWFNENNENKKKIGIHYKNENVTDISMMRLNHMKLNTQNLDRQVSAIEPGGRFWLSQNDSVTTIPLEKLVGWEAATTNIDGLYSYEYSVPISQRDDLSHFLDLENMKVIRVGIEIPELSDQEKEEMKEKMNERVGTQGGMRGRGSGKMGGGRRGRGGPKGGMQGDQVDELDGKELWFSVSPAHKNL